MMYLAAVEHRIRRGVAAVDRAAEELAGFFFGASVYERGVSPAHAAARRAVMDRAEQQRCEFVEREAEEEVAEPTRPTCTECGVGLGEVAAQSAFIPGMFCSVACVHDAEASVGRDVLAARRSAPVDVLATLKDAHWCSAHDTTRMACKDKPHQPSAEAESSEPECTCFWVDPSLWTVHCGATEPGSQMEWNPDCPVHLPMTSAHAGADTASAGTPAAEAPSPAAGVTHPAPAVGLPTDPSPTIASRLPSGSVRGEGSPADCDIPQSPAGERPSSEGQDALEARIADVVTAHHDYKHHSGDLFICDCGESFLWQTNFDFDAHAYHVANAVLGVLDSPEK